MPDYILPDNIRKSLGVLLVARDKREETMAARTLEAWRQHFTQPLPGLSAPSARATQITHFSADPSCQVQSAFSPVFIWRKNEMLGLLFSDQSAIVGREIEGRVQAIPMIFRIRKESRDPVPVVRSIGKPEAQVSFRLRKDQTCLPKTSASDPNIREHGGVALTNLEADLDTLRAAFDALPYVVQPFDRAPPETPGVVTLPYLPQRWFSDDEIALCKPWLKTLADWVFVNNSAYVDASVILNTRKPEMLGRPYILIEHAEYRYTYASSQGSGMGVKTGFGNVREIMRDPNLLQPPIPEDRLYQLTFHLSGLRQHSTRSEPVASATSTGVRSNHRVLATACFGEMGREKVT